MASDLVTIWSQSLPLVPYLISLLLQLWSLLTIARKDLIFHGVTCRSFPLPLLVLQAEDLLLMETQGSRISWKELCSAYLWRWFVWLFIFLRQSWFFPLWESGIRAHPQGQWGVLWLALFYFRQWQGTAFQTVASKYCFAKTKLCGGLVFPVNSSLSRQV